MDSIHSSCKITLLFQVQTHLSKTFHLDWTDFYARVVFIGLYNNEKSYAAHIQDYVSLET